MGCYPSRAAVAAGPLQSPIVARVVTDQSAVGEQHAVQQEAVREQWRAAVAAKNNAGKPKPAPLSIPRDDRFGSPKGLQKKEGPMYEETKDANDDSLERKPSSEKMKTSQKVNVRARPNSVNDIVRSSPSKKNAIKSSPGGLRILWKKGELIGCGSYGKVYIGLNETTGVLMAVKELQANNEAQVEALQAEISLMRSMRHENIVQYLGSEADQSRNLLYIFAEWVPGGSISNILQKFGRLTESVVCNYTAQLLQGLSYLHRKGIVHRDIKCANILVDDRGTIKLADFGASKVLGATGAGSSLKGGDGNVSLRGTPYYMAPEVIMQKKAGRKADIWSVGCTALHMISGKPPWKSLRFGSVSALMYHVCQTTEAPPMPDEISPQLRSFLMICFQREASERPTAIGLLQHPYFYQLPSVSAFLATQGSHTYTPKYDSKPRTPSKRKIVQVQIPGLEPEERSEREQEEGTPSVRRKGLSAQTCTDLAPPSGDIPRYPSHLQQHPQLQQKYKHYYQQQRHEHQQHLKDQQQQQQQVFDASETPKKRRVLHSPTTNQHLLRHVRSTNSLDLMVNALSSNEKSSAQLSGGDVVSTPGSQAAMYDSAMRRGHPLHRSNDSILSSTNNYNVDAIELKSSNNNNEEEENGDPHALDSTVDQVLDQKELEESLRSSLDGLDEKMHLDDVDDDGQASVPLKVPIVDELEVSSYLQHKVVETEARRHRFFHSAIPGQNGPEGEENEWTLRENRAIKTLESQKIRSSQQRQKQAVLQAKMAEETRWKQELAAELEFQRRSGLRT